MTAARIEHVALWTRDEAALERVCAFYATYFGAQVGERYESERRAGFVSRFLTFGLPGALKSSRLEVMTLPGLVAPAAGEAAGWAHVAIGLGSRSAVDTLVARLAADGVPVVGAPRTTGDGYYEAVVRDPEGNLVELTL